ncbi:putative palmitoyltransferase ZDHHC14 [Hypsibius exemplaris]|uniref:Palmitoyltransferase n=1 Tax=Hypsibius exemplaris TaxID=2072580 RepID=A0A1W0WAM2_HYPEX|nr:putative palmitoyltransferase ZDHHC14 [Hypsibius exemplaris]
MGGLSLVRDEGKTTVSSTTTTVPLDFHTLIVPRPLDGLSFLVGHFKNTCCEPVTSSVYFGKGKENSLRRGILPQRCVAINGFFVALPRCSFPMANTRTRTVSFPVPQTSVDSFSSGTKRWKVFPGKLMFFCGGRLMLSKQYGIFVLTLVLILATSVMFFVFDCPYLVKQVSVAFPIVGGILFAFTFSTLMRTAFSDPGIIPRTLMDETEYWDTKLYSISNPSESQSTANRVVARYLDIQMKDHVLKLKWCHTCKLFRPPRSSHCSICDNCIDQFDHHCPWVGNCVGKRNYRYFYTFVVTLSLFAMFIFGSNVAHLVLRSQQSQGGFVETIKATPASLVEAIICFLSLWSLLGLVGYHTYLVSTNMTTNEDIKGGFPGTDQNASEMFSHGSVFKNFFVVLCGPRPPSYIDATAELDPHTAAMLQREREAHLANAQAAQVALDMRGGLAVQESVVRPLTPRSAVSDGARPTRSSSSNHATIAVA